MGHYWMRRAAGLVLLAVALTSCATATETYQENPKTVLGSLGGAAAGAGIAALAGGGAGWIVGGALIGGLVGGVVGNYMDSRDKQMAAEAAARAFESNRTGQAAVWSNPDSGHSGSITPTRTFQASGQYCREYKQNIVIDGKTHQTYGTACRQSDGSWQVRT